MVSFLYWTSCKNSNCSNLRKPFPTSPNWTTSLEIVRNCTKMLTCILLAWADNGDILSTIYSGTGALKADFTRTGKRSAKGLWDDFCNSATRYYLNNFKDGKNQDAMNLVLGKFVVDHAAESPFKNSGSVGVLVCCKYMYNRVTMIVQGDWIGLFRFLVYGCC